MSNSDNALFQPFETGNLKLKNRIVMAPMTRNFSPNDNIPGDTVVEYYRRRAQVPAAIQGCLISMARNAWLVGKK
jgi:2,4-dienoyl-CoA reductase-like NADH-dependent reductase (Old Yellow Enzyme family)